MKPSSSTLTTHIFSHFNLELYCHFNSSKASQRSVRWRTNIRPEFSSQEMTSAQIIRFQFNTVAVLQSAPVSTEGASYSQSLPFHFIIIISFFFFNSNFSPRVPCFLLSVKVLCELCDLTDGKERAINRAPSFFSSHSGSRSEPKNYN